MNDSMEGLWARKLLLDGVRQTTDAETFTAFHAAVSAIEPPSPALMLSMSLNGDSLSQWRAYADDGHGVSVGFDINISSLLPPEADASMYAVDYELQASMVAGTVFGLQGILSQHGPQSEQAKTAFATEASGLRVKNPAFREEQEYRLVQRNLDMVTGYYARQDCIVSFAEYPLIPGPNGGQSINTVYLGPKNRTPEPVVKAMLKPFGNVEVLRSSATYR
jgi:hypothetical protein